MSTLSQVLLCNYSIWSSSVSVQSLSEDPKATQLSKEIDDINKALDQCKIQILSQLRVPLDNCNPVQDLERRLQEFEVILIPLLSLHSLLTPDCLLCSWLLFCKTILQKFSQTLKKLETEMSSIQRDVEPVLAKNPSGPKTLSLPLKLRATHDKIDDINNLISLSNKK